MQIQLGNVNATPGALEALDRYTVINALARHARGDWGMLGQDDKDANDRAVAAGERILSAYLDPSGAKFWIITEWDRSYTTVLLPDEY